MIYRIKPYGVCRQGVNYHSWNNWLLLVGPWALTFYRGRFNKYRVAP